MYNVEELLTEIEKLTQERNHWKTQYLGKKEIQTRAFLMREFNLTHSEAALTATLYAVYPTPVSRETAAANLPGWTIYDERDPKVVDIVLTRIKKKISKDQFEIYQGLGFTISKELADCITTGLAKYQSN